MWFGLGRGHGKMPWSLNTLLRLLYLVALSSLFIIAPPRCSSVAKCWINDRKVVGCLFDSRIGNASTIHTFMFYWVKHFVCRGDPAKQKTRKHNPNKVLCVGAAITVVEDLVYIYISLAPSKVQRLWRLFMGSRQILTSLSIVLIHWVFTFVSWKETVRTFIGVTRGATPQLKCHQW